MATDAKVTAIIAAEDKASATLGNINSNFGRLAGSFAAGTLIAGALQKTMGALTGFLSDSVDAFKESERVAAQMNATLTSTQHAAGWSAQQLLDLSQTMQGLTTYSDEAVLSVENLLLTFTNITGDQFRAATVAVLDMATAMGTDANSAAIQLGKALNDPINGVQSLARVGVQFSEAQKEVIETMVKTGDTIGAQKLILAELAKEFGGSATAQAQTFDGQMKQLANTLDDVQEQIGRGMVSALNNVFIAFNQATAGMESNVDVGRVVFQVFSKVAEFAAYTAAGVHFLAAAFVDLASIVVQATGVLQIFGIASNKNFSDFRAAANDGVKATADFAINLHNENQKTLNDWDKLRANSEKYLTSGPKAYQATAEAARQAADKIADANKKVAETTEKIRDLQEQVTGSVVDMKRDEAEAIVAQEKKITDLRKDISMEADVSRRITLQNQLDAELRAKANNATMENQLVNEVSEARRRAGLTDLERTLEDIQRKEIAELTQALKQMTRLKNELDAEQAKADAVAGIQRSTTTIVTEETGKQTNTIVAAANTQINKYNEVAAAAARAAAAASGAVRSPYFATSMSVSTPAMKIPGFAEGGVVPGPIGAPLLAVVHGGETVIPNGKSAAGSISITQYITGNNVQNEQDIRRLAELSAEYVMRDLRRTQKV